MDLMEWVIKQRVSLSLFGRNNGQSKGFEHSCTLFFGELAELLKCLSAA
jgi:hypothetical protein